MKGIKKMWEFFPVYDTRCMQISEVKKDAYQIHSVLNNLNICKNLCGVLHYNTSLNQFVSWRYIFFDEIALYDEIWDEYIYLVLSQNIQILRGIMLSAHPILQYYLVLFQYHWTWTVCQIKYSVKESTLKDFLLWLR